MTAALVIDDHPVTHVGCRPMLEAAGFDPILEARTCEEGYRLAARHRPGLILLDLGLPGVGGLAMIGRLLEQVPGTRILIFSMHDEPVFAARALEAGAQGYITKTVPPEELVAAVEALGRGEVYIEHALATKLAVLQLGRGGNPLGGLTARELQVLRLIGAGKTHGDIAQALNLSYKTVANTSSVLKSKLGARSLSDLIRIAIEHAGPAP